MRVCRSFHTLRHRASIGLIDVRFHAPRGPEPVLSSVTSFSTSALVIFCTSLSPYFSITGASAAAYASCVVGLMRFPASHASQAARAVSSDGAMCVPADTSAVILLCQATAASTVANLRFC